MTDDDDQPNSGSDDSRPNGTGSPDELERDEGSGGGDESGTGDGSNAGGGSAGGSGSGGDGGSDGSDDSSDISPAEKVVMGVSVAFTVALFGFALWYALAGPAAAPPHVRVVSGQPVDGSVAYTVELRNPADVGLVSTTVEANCTDPPTEVVFENVPAGARRQGTVVCPAGSGQPSVSVASWIEA